MDLIKLYQHESVGEGLGEMLTQYIGTHAYVRRWVSFEVACMISALAKRVDDNPVFFPAGRWATVHALDDRIQTEVDKVVAAHDAIKA